jgi:hypothetical protein
VTVGPVGPVGPVGLEPTTYGLKVLFSTDWAMPTCPV